METPLKKCWSSQFKSLLILAFAVIVGFSMLSDYVSAQQPTDPALKLQPSEGRVPGSAKGSTSDTEFWREIRKGAQGTVSIPDKQAGLLIQSEGELWRSIRNGPKSKYGAWVLLGMLIALATFFAVRGRIKIEAGRSSQTIIRFTDIERMAHWLLATSFIILAISGLNILYGRYIFPDLIGKEAFALASQYLKIAHNYVAFPFMISLILIFFLWIWHNIPSWRDIDWFLKGGGILFKDVHPKSKKFNAGQKIIFWVTILGGLSLSLSGWTLLFPYSTTHFADTFALLNSVFGFGLPENLTAVEEQQYAALWHSIVGIGLTAIIVAHIYIGSIGMQGAFAAMGDGKVDMNWAKEHHGLWVEEEIAKQSKDKAKPEVKPQPAE